MSQYSYDTVIIGAGPAGMGAAIPLQKENASVCVIDKAVFPRNKACAGLVTAKTYRLIQALFDDGDTDDLFCCESGAIRLFDRTKELTDTKLKAPVRLVNRSHFDNALVEKYKSLGGVIREGETVSEIDYDNNLLRLKSGDGIRYRNLLFADGALSMAHHRLNVDRRKLAFGIEAYLPCELVPSKSVDLIFGYLDSGYAWVFPHGDTVCVGAADYYDNRTDYRRLLTDILADLGVREHQAKYIGAFLPYGTVIPQDRLEDNVMLLGDAGGFTDPISGEGLYMALQSGAYAAKSLLTSNEPKEAYLERMETITRIVRDGRKVQKTFYSPLIQKAFLKKVQGKNELVGFFFEQMVDDYHREYRDIRKLLSDYKESNT